MEAHLQMWLGLLVRWAHFIIGIAWIGASFYFNWLENHLQRETRQAGVAGDLWAVHGGGFYYLKKFAVVPGELPPSLHWFKWEAYMTWVSGMALLIIVFYWNAQTYMLNPELDSIGSAGAIGIGLLALLASWVFYDLLCRSPISRQEWLLTILVLAWFTLITWTLNRWLSDRAAIIHVGAAIGTIMVANVFRVIIPAQKDLVRAMADNRQAESGKGLKALQRSRHNNYFTLPVLFIMINGHFPLIYSHKYNWLILLVFSIAAIAIRHYFNIRHLKGGRIWPLILAGVLMVWLIVFTAPGIRHVADSDDRQIAVDTSEIFALVQKRCIKCHAPAPEFAGFTAAPLGVELDSREKLLLHAERVYQSVVILRTMPLGNLTQITETERQQISAWFEALERSKTGGQ